MTVRYLSLIIVLFLCAIAETGNANDSASLANRPGLRLNFLVSPKQKKIDPAPLSFQFQAKIMRLFHKNEL